MRYAMPTFQM